VKQGYKSIESWHDYKIGTKTIYRGRRVLMDIGKSKDNFDKDKKPRCFNYNIYKHIVKKC